MHRRGHRHLRPRLVYQYWRNRFHYYLQCEQCRPERSSAYVNCDTVEPASAVLNASGTGSASYTSVAVNPVGTRTVSGTLATTLIDLNGADNVTINGLGGGNSLTLDNTSTAVTASTVHLVGDASNNLVTNCTIKGASSAVTRGTIFIDTGTTTGNIGTIFSN